ncbi:hypothetical protein [Clostridioides difficile]|uniref:hypothetical protein n=1 Tax=Clostridioides difficile TaxID=1496 RepID=UPI00111F3CD3|nr:hypothetical protein [Clostridioides difficile]TOY58249.1 hypothetical protein DA431_19890 [Clostridioides difficile]
MNYLGDEDIDYEFSIEFESKMDKIIKENEKKVKKNTYKNLKKNCYCFYNNFIKYSHYNYYKNRSFSRKFN